MRSIRSIALVCCRQSSSHLTAKYIDAAARFWQFPNYLEENIIAIVCLDRVVCENRKQAKRRWVECSGGKLGKKCHSCRCHKHLAAPRRNETFAVGGAQQAKIKRDTIVVDVVVVAAAAAARRLCDFEGQLYVTCYREKTADFSSGSKYGNRQKQMNGKLSAGR